MEAFRLEWWEHRARVQHLAALPLENRVDSAWRSQPGGQMRDVDLGGGHLYIAIHQPCDVRRNGLMRGGLGGYPRTIEDL